MDTDLFLRDINAQVRRHVQENFTVVRPEQLGLDRRASAYRDLYVNDDYIVVEGDGHMLDYYGGFEYVDGECIVEAGDFKFYGAGDSRVADHIATWKDMVDSDEYEA